MTGRESLRVDREHGPAGPAEWRDGAWVRSCLCGREFKSWESWEHVPALYDHLALVPKETLRD